MAELSLSKDELINTLTQLATSISSVTLKSLFANDPKRFPSMTATAGGLFLDYAKNKVTPEIMQTLIDLARACGLEEKREALFTGQNINITENRAALHTALRCSRHETVMHQGKNIVPDIYAVIDKMQAFTNKIHSGQWKGFSGKAITDVVHIGIGGSNLGPRMVCEALRPFHVAQLKVHFVSNIDDQDLLSVLDGLNPETTLFLVASKTFTTQETLCNANSARRWFLKYATERDLSLHFAAISTNLTATSNFGISPENVFPFWDWVGGRYSVWSAIGLPVMLAIGVNHFSEFLSGAHAMDVHFRYAPHASNMPLILALIDIWNRNFLNTSSLCIMPYLQNLRSLSAYLQQLGMESNGKQIQLNGEACTLQTSPVIWGTVGTNGQHAYFQMLHQGTQPVPVDFIAALDNIGEREHQDALLANCFAQSEALMRGKTPAEVEQTFREQGKTPEQIKALLPHCVFPGDRSSNTIVMNTLRPETIGALLALYEHKTFVQGIIWNINSFDQWGVELGKALAKDILSDLNGTTEHTHDSSTSGLIALARANKTTH